MPGRGAGLVLRFINTVSHRERRCAAPCHGARLRMGGDTPTGDIPDSSPGCGRGVSPPIRSVPLVARSATKRERGACPREGRQPRRSGCAVRPRRTTEHGAGVLAVRRAGRRESDKGLAVRSLAAGAGRPQGCLFCCDKRSPGCVGRARRSLVRRTCRTPPRSLLRLPAVAKGSPWSRDETLPGTGPPAAALECQGICETVH